MQREADLQMQEGYCVIGFYEKGIKNITPPPRPFLIGIIHENHIEIPTADSELILVAWRLTGVALRIQGNVNQAIIPILCSQVSCSTAQYGSCTCISRQTDKQIVTLTNGGPLMIEFNVCCFSPLFGDSLGCQAAWLFSSFSVSAQPEKENNNMCSVVLPQHCTYARLGT